MGRSFPEYRSCRRAFPLRKKSHAKAQADMERIVEETGRIRGRLLALARADAEGFAPLANAYAMERDDPARAGVIEEATKKACGAPLAMMHEIARAVELLQEASAAVSAMLLSDVACGALLCEAALRTAAVNVYVNTRQVVDREFAQRLEEEVEGLLGRYGSQAAELSNRLSERIRTKGTV